MTTQSVGRPSSTNETARMDTPHEEGVAQDIKMCGCGHAEEKENWDSAYEAVRRYEGITSPLIMVLHDIQDAYGYLPKQALQIVSSEMGLSMSEIFGVATFYSYFSLEPKGKHVLRVCLGTACYVKGSQAVLDELSKKLHVGVGETTPDQEFTLEATRCLGACGLAPVLAVEGTVHGKVTTDDVERVLTSFGQGGDVQ